MKRIIKKSLSVFLMLIMLVPLIGIMTSAEEPAKIENLWTPVKYTKLTTNNFKGFDFAKYGFKPGDVITVGPVSINATTTKVAHFRIKNGDKYTWSYLDKVTVGTSYNGLRTVQFTIPDIGADRVNIYIDRMFNDCALITINHPFTINECLDYMQSTGTDLSFLSPEEYAGEFVNVFPKSDSVLAGLLQTEKVDGKTALVVKENKNYYTSSAIDVKEGDLVCLASNKTNGYYRIWFFDATGNYLSYNISDTLRYFYNSSKDCRINAVVVPKYATSMRIVAYADSYLNGDVVVTINQPMKSAEAYNSCKKLKVSGIEKEYTYTGKVIKPAVELKIGGNVLELGKDYKLTYGNKNAGNKELTITFIGNYDHLGVAICSYKIVPKTVDLGWGKTEFVYNGKNQLPAAKVIGVISGDKCTAKITGAKTNCGTYTAKATLSNKNYVISENATCEYTITPKPVELVWESTSAVYNGNYQAPVAKVLGIVENDICDVIVSGAGKDVGTYVASAAISNPNYVISENTACSFAIAPKGVILTWSNTELFYTGRPQQPTALIFGLENNDVCNVLISGKGEELGSYTAVATLSNPNYFVAANAICNFTIIKSPIHESVGMPAEFVIDVLAIVPDSAEKAAAEAVNNAAKEAVEAASEAAQEVASEIAESVSNSFENIFDNLFSFFKNFGW
ncbi:MAG: hypothetical protein IKK74_00295 [Clostridia bacterium]|nr:hypothetical protein [Clostridia bacterium]